MSLRDQPPQPIQPEATYEDLLNQAAALVRIEAEYWDIWGHHHVTTAAAKEAILRSLGFEVGSREKLIRSLESHWARVSRRVLDPVAVLRVGESDFWVPFRIPAGYGSEATVTLALYLEDGSSRKTDLATIEGSRLPLPGDLPLGYHDLEVVVKHKSFAEIRATQRVIIAPPRAWMPRPLTEGRRLAGLAVSLYGLRSKHNWGVGDFGDLRDLVEWVANDLGAAFVALNPLHAIANRQPYNTSPYLPASSFFRNFLYLDIEAIADFQACQAAQTLRTSPKVEAEIQTLRASDLVLYERSARLKLAFLKLLFRQFRRELASDSSRAHQFRAWVAAQGRSLERFAVYCALDEALHKRDRSVWIWPDWPEQYQNPESPEVEQFAREHPLSVLFYQYLQWQIDVQLAAIQERTRELGMPIGLYHDLALATDRCGSDLWAYRNFFVSGCRVGSPPDDFSPDGQDWAFPPPNAETHHEHGYQLFIETIARNSRHGGALRIDHVMRFYRLFWIPDGLSAKDGTYVRDRFDDLLGILALESHRGKFIVVGEDLGTVPQEMHAAMERNGIFSYKLFYFEKGPHGQPKRPDEYPTQALVSSTTHDLPTLAGFWAGRDIDSRRAAGVLRDEGSYWQQKDARREEKRRMIEALIRDGFLPATFPYDACDWPELTGDLHNAIIGYLVYTPSQLMLLNQEDLTKELDQQNLPGTTAEYPNWQRKMRLTLDELRSSESAKGFTHMFRNWLTRTGRLTVPPESSRK